MNLGEIITAYSIVSDKIQATKNNLIRAIDMIFPGLTNAIDINEDTVDMLSKYVAPEDFISADTDEIEKYVSKRRYVKIMKIASDSPVNITILIQLLGILDVSFNKSINRENDWI